MIRLVFFGTNEESLHALDILHVDTRFEIVGLVTRPGKPKGRHLEMTRSSVAQFGQRHGFPVWKTLDAFRTAVHAQTIDLGVVVSYGAILSEDVLCIPRCGMVNVHPSLLPRWRGVAPVPSAILAGDQETGVTLMKMDAKMDHGPLLYQETSTLQGNETSGSLLQTLMKRGAELLPDVLERVINASIHEQPQQEECATFSKKLSREDGHIDWSIGAETLSRQVRAYDPWPGTWTELSRDGKIWTRMKILQAHRDHDRQEMTDRELPLSCLKNEMAIGALVLDQIQLEGKKPIAGALFARTQSNFSWRVRS